MNRKLMKADARTTTEEELEFDRAYYASLDTATRFRMIVERSILLLRLASGAATTVADRRKLIKRR